MTTAIKITQCHNNISNYDEMDQGLTSPWMDTVMSIIQVGDKKVMLHII